jgi:serine/threonine protein kinase
MATSIFKEYFKGYEILGELGRGNARVLKARSLQTDELVAIKHFAFNTEPDTLRRFQRESEIMKSIQHDYIVKIIEVHLDAELPYIVMQLVDGGDLRSLLKNYGTLDINTVITLAHEITEALDAIHTKAIVHRDIKPENIMYRRRPTGEIQFLLTDFGIARLREQPDTITVTGSSMLTYEYASPEQFNQSKTVSTPTDYYSLGVVLYECLTGAVPFEYEQDDLLMHINRVISSPLPVPLMPGGRSLPPSLLLLLEGLMRKQASDRLCNSMSVRHLLKMAAIEDLQGIKVLPASTPKQTTRNDYLPPMSLAKKSRRTPGIIAVLLVSIGILFSWANLGSHSNSALSSTLPDTTASLAIKTMQALPLGAHIIRTRRTSSIIAGSTDASAANQGIPLVNGMYYNDFDQQDSSWDVGRDDNSEFILLDGKYVMKGLTDSLSYSSSIKLNMNVDKDFTVAATAIHQGEGVGDPFGINFCGDEATDACFVFYITSNGYYAIGTSVKDDWNVLVDWTASSNIRQDAEMNIFSIEKRGRLLRFLINDKVERVLPYTGGYGSYFGLRVDGAQTVSFDQFIVKGSQPTNN